MMNIKYFTEANMNRGPLLIQPQEDLRNWKLQNNTISIAPFAQIYKRECQNSTIKTEFAKALKIITSSESTATKK